MKIVISTECGGLRLSYVGTMRYAELVGLTLYPYIENRVKSIYGDTAPLGGSHDHHRYSIKPVIDGEDPPLEDVWRGQCNIQRTDPALIQVVEELGEDSGCGLSYLKIVEIPDDVDWELHAPDWDGEWIAEKHRTWS